MTQYWSYLTNKQNQLLTFESHCNLEKMKSDYDELTKCKFFNQFQGFTTIFVSDRNPTDKPIEGKLFELSIM